MSFHAFVKVIISSLVASLTSLAFAATNSSVTYQGRILKPDGAPLTGPVNFQFTIKSPTGCVLWTESALIDMTGTNGGLSYEIGPTGTGSGGMTFSQVFQNNGTLGSGALVGCAGGNYIPNIDDDRTVTVGFNDGTGSQTIPNILIKSVPFAKSAENTMGIMGKSISGEVPSVSGQLLQYDSVAGLWKLGSFSASGVSSVDLSAPSSIFNVTGGPIITAGTLNLALANQAQNTIFAGPTSGTAAPSFRGLVAADIPNLNASQITSGTLSAAIGGTGLVPAVAKANQVIGLNAAGTNTEYKEILGGSGVTVSSGTAGQIVISASVTGAVTNINTGIGLTGGPITSVGTISLVSSGVVAGTYGSVSNYVPWITLDTFGRATTAGSLQISLDANQITAGTLNTAQLGAVPISALPAQSTNVSNTLVLRDGTGSFAAGTATLQGLTLQGFGTVGISTPLTANYSMILPANIGTAGQVLTTNGTSATSWTTIPVSQWTNISNGVNYASGSVGVGSASPAAMLDIAGGVRIANDADSCAPGKAGTIRYASSSIQFCNGTSWGTLGVAGAGITNFNGMTGGSQTFGPLTYVGTSGTFSSSADVHTLNIPLATTGAAVAGLISNADYLRFNSKLDSSLTTGSLWIGQAGIATQVSVSGDATLSSLGTLSLGTTGVFAGTYPRVTVDAKGRVTSAGTLNVSDIPSIDYLLPSQTGNAGKILSSNGTVSAWTNPAATGVTSVAAGAGLSGGTISSTGTLSLATTTVAAGSFGSANFIPTFIVDAYGRLTGAGSVAVAATADLSTIAGTLGVAKGGTGLNASSAANGQLLVGNGSGFTLGTLNSSTGVVVTNSAGTINVGTNAQTTNAINTLVMRDGTGSFAADTATLQGLTLQGLGTVAISTPATANYSMVLPQNIGTPGQVLTTNGTSGLTWSTSLGSQWTSVGLGVNYSAGSVGIGTTTPQAILDVLGAGGVADFRVSRSAAQYLAISSIGGPNLSSNFSLNGGSGNVSTFSIQINGGALIGSGYAGGATVAPVNGLAVQGSVGIGTTSPADKLDIRGNSRFNYNGSNNLGYLQIDQGAGSSARIYGYDGVTGATAGFMLNSNGNSYLATGNTGSLGVGLINPAALLDVAGGIRIANDADACVAGKAGTIRYASSAIQFCNGTSWGTLGVAGAGVTNIGGATAGAILLGTSTAGTAPAWSSTAGSINLALPLASIGGVTAGLISKTDYDAFNAKQSTSLGTGSLWIGQAGVATQVSVSGDATLSSLGTLSLGTTGVLAGSYPRVTVDAKGRVTSAGTLNIADIPSIDYLLPSQAGNAGKILSSNGTISAWTNPAATGVTSVAAGTGLSGGTISSTGTLSLATTTVAAGSFGSASFIPTFVVDAYGRLTGAGSVAVAAAPDLSSIAGTLGVAKGGTGLNAATAANGQLLVGNGSGFTLGTLNSSTGVVVTNTAGTINVGTNAQTTNAVNTLVMRDGTGGFAAGTATLQGLTLQGLGTVGISTPLTANYSLTLPQNAGTSGMALITNGSGVLSWGSVASGTTFPLLSTTLGSVGTPAYSFSGNTNTGLFSPGANTLGFSTAGANRLNIDSNGNIGIGTTTPNALLEVGNSVNQKSLRITGGSAADTAPVLSIFRTAVSHWALGGGGNSSGDLSFSLNPASYSDANLATSAILTMTASSRVGIMNSNPGAALDVKGVFKLSGTTSGFVGFAVPNVAGNTQYTLPSADGSAGQMLATNGSGSMSWASPLASGGTLLAANGSASGPGISFTGNTNTGIFNPGANTLGFSTAGVNRLNIDSSGNVGIGTFATGNRLEVGGGAIKASAKGAGAGQGGELILGELVANGTNSISFRSPDLIDQNVVMTLPGTIGTAGQVLSTDGAGTLSWITSGTGNGDFMKDGSVAMTGALRGTFGTAALPSYTFFGDTGLGIFRAGAGSLGISTAGAERIRIDSAGNVGLGTSTPAYALHVSTSMSSYGMVQTSGTIAVGSYVNSLGGWYGTKNNSPLNLMVNDGNPSFTINAGRKIAMGALSATPAPVALVNLQAAIAPTTLTAPNHYLQLGGPEFATNSYRTIGFGYMTSSTNNSPAYMGFQETNIVGNTYGDLIFGTRNVTSDSAPSERMRINSGGSVGIGTATPSAILDVVGNMKASGTATFGTLAIASAGTVNIVAASPANFTLTLPTTGGTAGHFLKTDGTGVLSWATISTATTFPLLSTTTGSVGTPAYSFALESTTGLYSPGAGEIALSTAGAQRLRFTTSGLGYVPAGGSFGVGLSNPSAVFHVVSVNGSNMNNDGYGTGPAIKMRAANGVPGAVTSATVSGDELGRIQFDGNTAASGSASFLSSKGASLRSFAEETFSASASGSNLRFYTTQPTTIVPVEVMRITGLGNIGIGTTGVGATNTKLRIVGQAATSSGSIATGSVDFVLGNAITTNFDCGSNITLANIRDGGSYTLAVTGTGTSTCNFSTTTTGDDSGTMNFRFSPANGVRTSNSHTLYSMQRIGNIIYVSWITGF